MFNSERIALLVITVSILALCGAVTTDVSAQVADPDTTGSREPGAPVLPDTAESLEWAVPDGQPPGLQACCVQ